MSTTTVTHEIQRRLTAIALQHGVTILYAAESGSRAWGFASQPIEFDALLDAANLHTSLRAEIHALLRVKRAAPETWCGEPIGMLDEFSGSELQREAADLSALSPPEDLVRAHIDRLFQQTLRNSQE